VPPELWHLKTDEENWNAVIGHAPADASGSLMARLPIPQTTSEGGINSIPLWGEASFIGPNDEFIVCDVDGEVRFYEFNRAEDVVPQLNVQDVTTTDMPKPNFSDFYHTVCVFGETSPSPVMVIADVDGKGKLSAWTVRNDSDSPTLGGDGLGGVGVVAST